MYSNTLNSLIFDSQLTKTEIADKCTELGQSVTREYISQLASGKAKSPSDSLSSCLEKVCNAPKGTLVLEAYLDKAPEELIEFIRLIQYESYSVGLTFVDNNFSTLVENETSLPIESIDKQKVMQIIKETLKNESCVSFILECLKNKDEIHYNTQMDSVEITNNNNNLMANFSRYTRNSRYRRLDGT